MSRHRFSAYYRAHIPRENVWFFVATIRSFDNLVFDRTVDVENSIFELYVSPDRVQEFEALIGWYQQHGYVQNLEVSFSPDIL